MATANNWVVALLNWVRNADLSCTNVDLLYKCELSLNAIYISIFSEKVESATVR